MSLDEQASGATILRRGAVVLGVLVAAWVYSVDGIFEQERAAGLDTANVALEVEWATEDSEPVAGRRDPASRLLRRVLDSNYDSPEEIAAGRCLNEFDDSLAILERVDLERSRPVRKGVGWARIAVVCPHEDGNDEYFELRLVKEETGWKAEHLRKLRAEELPRLRVDETIDELEE